MGLNLYKDYALSKNIKYNITHPLRWIRSGLANMRFVRQRARKGYAAIDWWNMDDWFLEIIPNMLDELADRGYSYPGNEEFDTPEKWKSYLHNLANDFRMCTQDASDELNEYYQEFLDSFDTRRLTEEDEDGNLRVRFQDTPEGEEIAKKYFARCKEISEEQDTILEEAMLRLAHILPSLWD